MTPRLQAMMDQTFDNLPVGSVGQVTKTRVVIRYRSLLGLVASAYKARTSEVFGPGWMADIRFDVDAKIPTEGQRKQVNEMLQALLVERFGLEFHRETREYQGYALVVDKGGSKLTPSVPDPNRQEAIRNASGAGDARAMVAVMAGKDGSKVPPGMNRNSWNNLPVSSIAHSLALMVGAPVVDMTELEGNYDAVLDIPSAEEGEGQDLGPRVLVAIRTLGLRLQPRKVPVSVLVIDKISKTPTEN